MNESIGGKGRESLLGFRLWQPQDAPWIDQATTAAALESLSPQERAAVPPQTVAARAISQWRTAAGSPVGAVVLATAAQVPVGCIVISAAPDSTTGEPNGHLLSIWVAPAWRRRGVGRGLKHVAERLFWQRGIRKVKLWTGLHNQPALRLATQAGYRPEGLIGMKHL